MSGVPRHAHGMFTCEREIMDLWDHGESIETIAGLTVRQLGYVRSVVGRYAHRRDPFERMVREGSALLLAAIQLHHPELFAGGVLR